MKNSDEKKLQKLKFSPEVIEKVKETLNVWGIDQLFTTCSYCNAVCYDPNVPRSRYRRKKLPAELFYDVSLMGFLNNDQAVICGSCDEEQFQ